MTNWLELNSNRHYPLTYVEGRTLGGTDFTKNIVLDAGFIFGVNSGFDPASNYVYLHSVDTTAGTTTVVVKANTDPAIIFTFTFTANSADTYRCVATADDNIAFIVMKDTTLSGTTTSSDFKFEPATAQSLWKGYVKSINAANMNRFTSRLECDPVDYVDEAVTYPDGVFNSAVVLKEGYNCKISTNINRNTLIISASTGSGSGVLCGDDATDVIYGEVPITADELAELESSLPNAPLSGGPLCDEIVASINGAIPDNNGNVTIIGRNGVSVRKYAEAENTLEIVIDVNAVSINNCDVSRDI